MSVMSQCRPAVGTKAAVKFTGLRHVPLAAQSSRLHQFPMYPKGPECLVLDPKLWRDGGKGQLRCHFESDAGYTSGGHGVLGSKVSPSSILGAPDDTTPIYQTSRRRGCVAARGAGAAAGGAGGRIPQQYNCGGQPPCCFVSSGFE